MSPFATAPRPIRTVLIANRGEIACRIIATCRRLGLRTVAVYSDADAGALHVRLADEAHRIGPPPATASYLAGPAILAAVHAAGADAIHPGYGFLSENAGFVRACEAAGIVFVGPSADAVAAMGSKIEAKRIAIAAGVPTVPGYHGADQSPDRLAAEAKRIGYPVLIKASAGGGGRGMRLVERPEDFTPALEQARTEARSAFGDDAVLLEKFIARPRHLEVQVFGDSHGNLVHLFERDCSVQRNNQKVFEEAPAPNLPDVARARLFEAALRLCRAIGYSSAGTVEFIMEAGGDSPYFLEMNTRLQVEHPVTEAICGVDLVEWQLLVAAGLPLPLAQDQIRARGHAIEARIAAERPDLGFQPAIGRFVAVSAPAGIRFDTGIAAGTEIGLHYDSMLAKLIAHGPDRASALARLERGLADLAVLGPATNQAFLKDCATRPAFAAGQVTTRFLPETFPDGWRPDAGKLAHLRAIACAIWALNLPDGGTPWTRRDGFRVMGARRPARLELVLEDEFGEATLDMACGVGGFTALIDGRTIALGHLPRSGDIVIDGRPVTAVADGDLLHVAHDGLVIAARITPAIDVTVRSAAAADADGMLIAPLPGLVTAIPVRTGDMVAEGDPVLTMEAMKLVHTLSAPVAGRIAAIHCAVGDTVAAKAVLVEISHQSEE